VSDDTTRGDPATALGRAAAAYEALGQLGENVEDEWLYVTDLVAAYLPAIRALRLPTGDAGAAAAALDEAIAEIGSISDPHRAIDWLSTFPHVVALAVGGDVDTVATGEAVGPGPAESEPDDDSPFRFLLGRDR